MSSIVTVLNALGQQTRLDVLTLLARGPVDGQTSGDLALQTQVPANSMSTHLGVLAAAGLVSQRRWGRRVIYRIVRENLDSALDSLTARFREEIPAAYGPQGAGRLLAYLEHIDDTILQGPKGVEPLGAKHLHAARGNARISMTTGS